MIVRLHPLGSVNHQNSNVGAIQFLLCFANALFTERTLIVKTRSVNDQNRTNRQQLHSFAHGVRCGPFRFGDHSEILSGDRIHKTGLAGVAAAEEPRAGQETSAGNPAALAAIEAERAKLASEKASFEAEKTKLESARRKLEGEKQRLEEEKRRLESAKSELESEKQALAAELDSAKSAADAGLAEAKSSAEAELAAAKADAASRGGS